VGSVDRIARVVRSLMDAGRRSGRAPVDVGAVRLLDCVEHALAAASTVAAPNVDTTVQVPDALVVEGDQGVLVQILSNLLVNARQAMRRDGVTRGTVHVVARQVDAWVQVDVVDDGPGIPQQVQKRLFEPFFTTRDPGDGTGLGLAVANGLAHALGARLTLAHTGAGGTTMRLTLRAAAPVPAPSLLPLLPGTRKRLLVVDDEPAVLRALQRVLSPRHDVTLSATVEDGLRHALGGAVDVILCDVMMPDGGAQQFYTQLQSTRPDLLERLVFITGGATNDATAAFLRRAGRPVLEKPVDPAALSRVVDASGPPSLTQDQGHPAHVPVH
jgi:CheY-like chemotaxis protein/anti-sigma regulatory factor (Ser/Thr protein kinase)